MEKRWHLQPEPPQQFFDEHPELPRSIGTILYHRGLRTQAQIDEFLNPDYAEDVHDPFLFRDMEKAVRRLFQAIESGEKITIHGDYDADGVSASVILVTTLRALGATEIDVYLPHRETDGYGLNVRTVQYLADTGTKVVITCDCGISNRDEVALANTFGIDTIITDHHSIPPTLPDAFAIIHPKVEGETYPDQTLAGGGVAFKLAQGLLRVHRQTHESLENGETHDGFEKWLLDMVAIASVADMVPLLGESRTLTKYGLIVLNKTRRLGLQKLLLQARLTDERGTPRSEIDARAIGFHIAPRINAAGRVDHANVAYELLVEEDPEQAAMLAEQLNDNNIERRSLTEQFVKEGMEQLGDAPEAAVLGVFGEHWTTGTAGLIASRLKDRYQKPVIAMARKGDEITGSGRSVDGFNLVAAMQELSHFFTKFGGHPMACGFTLKEGDTRDEFLEALSAVFDRQMVNQDLTPLLNIDAEVALEEVNWELFDVLERCKPFGQCNPKPTYLARGLTVVAAERMGKDGSHLKLLVKHNGNTVRKTVGWGLCSEDRKAGGPIDWCTLLSPGDIVDLVFEVDVNEWNGSRELQLGIVDLKRV